MQEKTTNQGSPQMPLIKLKLPKYVTIRWGKGETPNRYLFQPKRHLAPNWPSAIRIPLDESIRKLGDDNLQFIRAMEKDAKDLLDMWTRAKNQESSDPKYIYGTIPYLLAWWENESDHWQVLKLRTQKDYRTSFPNLKAWSETLGNPHVKEITPAVIRIFQNSGVLLPSVMRNAIRTLSTVLTHAVELSIIDTNPVGQLGKLKKVKSTPKKPVTIWAEEDVRLYVYCALKLRWRGGAILIQGLWDSIGRLSDATRWTKQMFNSETRILNYMTSKSDGEYEAFAEMSSRFAKLVKNQKSLYLVTRTDNIRIYRESLDDAQLSKDFNKVRRLAVALGGRHLVLGKMRHSGITHATKLGVTHSQLKVQTTHQTEDMAIENYIQADIGIAKEIARMRGIK